MPSMSLYRMAGVVLCFSAYVGATCPALADAIDGTWCFSDGKRMFIQGPAIITPGGSHVQGEYGRHSFSYVATPADPGAGQTVWMLLINEDTVHLRIGAPATYSSDGADQEWRRCGPPTS
jgi:hypothetical protein